MIEDDEMRLAFFDPEVFGVEVTATPNTGEPFKFFGIFDARPVGDHGLSHNLRGAQVGFDGGAQVTGVSPRVRCRASDVANIKPARCTIRVDGDPRTFNVFDNRPDSTGFAELTLKVA